MRLDGTHRGDKVIVGPNEKIVPMPPMEFKRGLLFPNRVERTVRVVLHLVAIVTMFLCSLVLLAVLLFMGKVGAAVDRIDPSPATTGCPFGDLECGG